MSEPSAACTAIDSSGPMNRSEPSMYERKATPRSEISITPPLDPEPPRRPLISSATLPCASEKTWNPPESVMIARSQPMNSCRPPSRGDPLGAGGEEEVERVAEHELEAEPGDVAEVERPHGAPRRQRDEGRRRDGTVGGEQAPGPGGSVACLDLEFEPLGVVAHDPEACPNECRLGSWLATGGGDGTQPSG